MADFQDLVFKLVVINHLMYRDETLPRFDLKEVERATGKALYVEGNWVLPEDGYFGMIPEVKAHFEAYEVPAELLGSITSLHWEGGEELQGQVAPNWDGEDSLFDLTEAAAADLHLLPSLKEVSALHRGEAVVKAFAAKGVALTDPYA